MKQKFKKGLVSQVKKDLEEQEKQTSLRKKYNIKAGEEGKVVVVEKSYLIVGIGKLLANVTVYILASIGLLSLIYPTCREALLGELKLIWMQLLFYF